MGFDRVNAHTPGGGTDRAYLYDSTGNDTFFGTQTWGSLSGPGFYNYANGFARVEGWANKGGTDRAYLYDSAGDDLFFGRADYGRLSGTGFYNYVNGFGAVDIYGTAGGTNTKNTDGSLTYTLVEVGTWV